VIHRSAIFVSLIAVLCTACAGVNAIPLHADGSVDWWKWWFATGVRYYLPKPYLIIAELPATPNPPKKSDGDADSSGLDPSANPPSPKAKDDSGSDKQPQVSAPSAPPSNTSFAATMAQYSVKLIYLPDFSHPMALKMRSGLLGTASAAPTLQDGWMLTSLSASSDNGVANTLQGIAAVVSGAASTASGGGKGGASGGTTTKAMTTASRVFLAKTKKNINDISPEELEEYGFDVGRGVAPVHPSLEALSSENLKSVLRGIAKGKTAEAGLPWGGNVLPAGLYEFDYWPVAEEKTPGELRGLKPVAYFCKGGVVIPTVAAEKNGKAASEAEVNYKVTYQLTNTPCEHP